MYRFILLWVLLLSITSCTLSEQSPGTTPKKTTQSITGATYLDVREDDEWAAWHVSWALHIKLSDIESGKLPSISKDAPIAVYCRSGRRSGIATDILQKNGFIHAYNAGGMTELKNVSIIQ